MASPPDQTGASSAVTAATTAALRALDLALDGPRQAGVQLGNWRWVVRQRMAALRDALIAETNGSVDGWLAARGGAALRERNAYLVRLSTLGPVVLQTDAVESIRTELKRLVVDIGHHVQRLHDLAYDEVELELGGSE